MTHSINEDCFSNGGVAWVLRIRLLGVLNTSDMDQWWITGYDAVSNLCYATWPITDSDFQHPSILCEIAHSPNDDHLPIGRLWTPIAHGPYEAESLLCGWLRSTSIDAFISIAVTIEIQCVPFNFKWVSVGNHVLNTLNTWIAKFHDLLAVKAD